MTFSFEIPTPVGPMDMVVDPGTSLYFVGANGGGKTRLAVKIEEALGETAHRISAHRALALDPTVAKVSERVALMRLRIGTEGEGVAIRHRDGSRWGSNAAVNLLNDYNSLIQSLFAEQANTSLQTHKNARMATGEPASATKFEKLIEIWDRVLPHRMLEVTGDDVQVSVPGSTTTYGASQMSDGERAVFYLIGQVLVAAENSLIIFDEPELHVHRSIVNRLWDELEAARPDCAFVVISHDLEFVAGREGQKFVLLDYDPVTGWTIEDVPADSGFSEETTTLILGSRTPILFVEGSRSSLDEPIYRACYPDWTIIPRGSCEEVVHAVITMRANASLTRIKCAGIIDADSCDTTDVQYLNSKGIAVLPVSEIENVLLLPEVLDAILGSEGFNGRDLTAKREAILDELFQHAADPANQQATIMRFCRRRIDQMLKKIDLSATSDIPSLAAEYSSKTASLDVVALATSVTAHIQQAIAARDAAGLLKWYDNKGVLGIACKAKGTKKSAFEQWVVRSMRGNTVPALSAAIQAKLPAVNAI